MKKRTYLIIGIVIGAVISSSSSAIADSVNNLIGKKVDGLAVVVLDGKELGAPVALIEGTSYAPIRAIGEAVGREVEWRGGKVMLNTKPIAEEQMDYTQPEKYPRMSVEFRISVLQVDIVAYKSKIEQGVDVAESKRLVEQYEAELAIWKARLVEIEAAENAANQTK